MDPGLMEFLELLTQGGVNAVTIMAGGAILLRYIKQLHEKQIDSQAKLYEARIEAQDERIDALEEAVKECARDRTEILKELENHRERSHQRMEEIVKIVTSQRRQPAPKSRKPAKPKPPAAK